MKKINYIQILKEAWRITWKNHYLWWFGFFILISSCGGFFSINDSHEERNYQQAFNYIASHQQLAIMVGIVIFLVWLGFLVMGIIGRGALIKSAQKNIEGESSSFKEGFQAGKKYFWKIIFISLLATIFAMAAMFIFVIPITILFSNKAFILGGIMIFLAIVVLIPVLFLISFSQIFGSLYAVLADLAVWDSLEKGYHLILKNVGSSILMTLLLLLVSIVPGILLVAAVLILVIPALIVGGLLFLLFKTIGIILTACLFGIILAVFGIFVGSILKVFSQAAWILFFKEIARTEKREEVSEIEKEEIKTTEITGVPA